MTERDGEFYPCDNMNRIKQLKKHTFTNDNIGYLMIFAAGSLWGTIGLFVKLLSGVGANISLTAFIRLFMGFWILVPIMLFTGKLEIFKIDKKSLIQCLLLGILSQALFNYCYNVSIGSVGVDKYLCKVHLTYQCICATIYVKLTLQYYYPY